MANNVRISMALNALDYLEDIISIDETPRFVQIVGGIGGDISKYQVYFDENNNITGIYVK